MSAHQELVNQRSVEQERKRSKLRLGLLETIHVTSHELISLVFIFFSYLEHRFLSDTFLNLGSPFRWRNSIRKIGHKPRSWLLFIRSSSCIVNHFLIFCAWRLHPNTRNQAKGMLEECTRDRWRLWFASTRSIFQLLVHLSTFMGYLVFTGWHFSSTDFLSWSRDKIAKWR